VPDVLSIKPKISPHTLDPRTSTVVDRVDRRSAPTLLHCLPFSTHTISPLCVQDRYESPYARPPPSDLLGLLEEGDHHDEVWGCGGVAMFLVWGCDVGGASPGRPDAEHSTSLALHTEHSTMVSRRQGPGGRAAALRPQGLGGRRWGGVGEERQAGRALGAPPPAAAASAPAPAPHHHQGGALRRPGSASGWAASRAGGGAGGGARGAGGAGGAAGPAGPRLMYGSRSVAAEYVGAAQVGQGSLGIC
jgi:hypothetical protein